MKQGIRVFLYWIVFIGLFMAVSFLYNFLPSVPARLMGMRLGVTGTIVALLVTWIFLRTEKKSFGDIGLQWQKTTLSRFIKGLLLGTAICIVVFGCLLAFSGLRLARNSNPVGIMGIIAYLAFIPLALMEEIAFRSYSLITLNRTFGLRISQVIVAVAFALYHIAMGWNPYIAFTGPFVWSFVFGLSAAWSGGISAPTGIHIALNVAQVMIGLKTGSESIWTVSFPEGTSNDSIARANTIGLILQVAILAGTLIATEFFLRRKRQKIASLQ